MHKRKRFVQILLILATVCLIAVGLEMKPYAKGNLTEKKIIYIVYDNSSSTYVYGGVSRNYWAEINYGVQGFYAMTDKEDKIKIYFTATEEILDWNGYGGDKGSLDQIRSLKVHPEKYESDGNVIKSVTHMSSIESAITALDEETDSDAEKWLVIFTDGKMERVNEDGKVEEYSKEEMAGLLNTYLEDKDDIRSCYIPIDEEAENEFLDESLIFQPTEDSIVEQLIEVCNHIYKRRSVRSIEDEKKEISDFEDGVLDINFDIPIENCVLYAYCNEFSDGQLYSDEIAAQDRIYMPEKLSFIDGKEETNDEMENGVGFVAVLHTDPSQNSSHYEVEFPDNISNIEYDIYYEPAFQITMQIQQGVTKNEQAKYFAGEYEVTLDITNRETGESISESAKFMSVEKFYVIIPNEDNEEESSLNREPGENRWRGSAKTGKVKFQVYTEGQYGIDDECEVEFLDDYNKAELAVVLENLYYIDRMDKKEQFVQIQAMLDGRNVTDEIENLVQSKEDIQFICYLNENGKEVSEIHFELQDDPADGCWKLYPVLEEDADLKISNNYDLNILLKVKLDCYEQPIEIGNNDMKNFRMGISGGTVDLDMENPWECRPEGFFFPRYDGAELNFLWNKERLPVNVLKEINVSKVKGESEDNAYTVFRDGNKVELRCNTAWNSIWKAGSDTIKVAGIADIYGEERKIISDDIKVTRYGVSRGQVIRYCSIWTAGILFVIFIICWILKCHLDVKRGKRFSWKTKILRTVDERDEIPAKRHRGKRMENELGERRIVYRISVYLPKEFGAKNDQFEIKAERNKNCLVIWSLEEPENCEKIYLGNKDYKLGNRMMELSEEIKLELKDDQCTVRIWFENT